MKPSLTQALSAAANPFMSLGSLQRVITPINTFRLIWLYLGETLECPPLSQLSQNLQAMSCTTSWRVRLIFRQQHLTVSIM
ncbi:hypothetical protein N431DRAFT_106713 [Stipitochalara longipes BDJ]|nr:hypothetical protein N431DRAFT_106713 [Stipitochalara longipes BDJ]